MPPQNILPGNLLEKGKVSVLFDGQFGSSGKGLFAAYLAQHCPPDITSSNAAPNAGHTAVIGEKTIVTKHLPLSGVVGKVPIYLNAGARINPDVLLEECRTYDVDPALVTIHPRAAVITADDLKQEQNPASSYAKIASTQSGVGAAMVNKIRRCEGAVAEQSSTLAKNFNIARLDLNAEAAKGKTVLLEMPQGYGLGLDEGYAYPYCTSRPVTVPQALADANVHPHYFGKTLMCLRTFPIRVGNLMDEEGREIGHSGPFYPDSTELSWADVGQPPEQTTNTQRVRRVATFSYDQYREVVAQSRPDTVFLNFANYCTQTELATLRKNMCDIYRPEHLFLGFGARVRDIIYDREWKSEHAKS